MKQFIPRHPEPRNGGSTLTEVLIATMVLSIGVISVGTLFPLSLARAIRANQVTQSTIHRYNCEAQIEALKLNNYWIFVVKPGLNAQALTDYDNHFPGKIGDDNGNLSPDIDTTNVNSINGYSPGLDLRPGVAGIDDDVDSPPVIDEPDEIGWSNTTYFSDDQPYMDEQELLLVNGTDTNKVVIDPIGWHRMASVSSSASGATFQNNFGGDFYPANIGGTQLPRVNGGYFANNQWLGTNPAVRPYFWRDRPIGGNPPDQTPNDEWPSSGGFGFSLARAEELATLQDQYSTTIDTPYSDTRTFGSIPPTNRLSLTANGDLQLSDLTDINNVLIAASGGLKVRAVFFGLKNAANPTFWTESRFLINPNSTPAPSPPIPAGSIGWNEMLPAQFQIDRVVLQIQNLDFTWMVTARLTGPPPTRPQMDVVIFHKRRFEASDEQLYVATQSVGNLNQVTINFSAGQRPKAAKKGGWMFDVEHCIWYQVVNLQETSTQMTLTLETRIRDRYDGPMDNQSAVVVAFMQGIVDVFPIGTK